MKAVISLLALFALSASAESWIGIDGYYYDKDSRKRSGDIAEIRVKDPDSVGTNSWHVAKVDCKRDLWLYNGKAEPIPSYTVWSEIAKQACKKSWEVWK